MHTADRFIPALNNRLLTPLYDPLIKRFMHEQQFKTQLIEQAKIQPGMQVLDLGCGTATLTMMIKQSVPQARVTGLDVDPQILEIASQKVVQAGLDITLDQGLAYALPYPGNYFDRLVSSLMIHHLTSEDKFLTFKEIFRVLKPGGEFHLVDFGVPISFYARLVTRVMQNFEDVADNFQGRLIDYVHSAGFAQVEELGHTGTLFGTLAFIKAVK